MKVTIEIDWTPQEARTFFGQPDLEPFNAWLVEEMKSRYARNLDAMRPEELMRNWMSFGGQATEQFRRMMETAATSAGTAQGAARGE
jgi:hypothetical protein